MRDPSLSWVIPDTSALNIDSPPVLLSDGMMAMVKSTIPRPPSHCVNPRQSRMPWLHSSTSRITVAPVVVKPDIASKNPSLTLSGVAQIRNGIIPSAEKATHTRAVSRQPSRRPKRGFLPLVRNFRRNAQQAVTPAPTANAFQSLSPRMIHTDSGISIKSDSTKRRDPKL